MKKKINHEWTRSGLCFGRKRTAETREGRSCHGVGEQWSGPSHLGDRGGRESDGLERALYL